MTWATNPCFEYSLSRFNRVSRASPLFFWALVGLRLRQPVQDKPHSEQAFSDRAEMNGMLTTTWKRASFGIAVGEGSGIYAGRRVGPMASAFWYSSIIILRWSLASLLHVRTKLTGVLSSTHILDYLLSGFTTGAHLKLQGFLIAHVGLPDHPHW
jgi:hypothetical protein